MEPGNSTASGFGLARYNTDGSLDTTFGVGGKVQTDIVPTAFSSQDFIDTIAIEADGQIVVGGYAVVRPGQFAAVQRDFVIARYDADGSLDTAFNPTPSNSVPGTLRINVNSNFDFAGGLVLQPDADGKYVIAGLSGTSSDNKLGMARVWANGTMDGQLDLTFDPDGATGDFDGSNNGKILAGLDDIAIDPFLNVNLTRINDAAIQPDGKVVVVGWARPDGGNRDVVIVRYDLGLGPAPTADAGGPYPSLDETGGTFMLDGSGSVDTVNSSTTVYEWDLDGDGIYGEIGGDAANGDEVGVTPTFTATSLDGDSTLTLKLKVTNENGLFHVDTVPISVTNIPPTVAVSGAADVNEGSLYTLNLGAVTDPGLDTITNYEIFWGDGSSDQIVGNPESTIHTHTYDDGPLTANVTITLNDEDGLFSNAGDPGPFIVNVNNVDPTADDAAFDLVENSANGTVVGTVTATDPGDDTLVFNIVGGTGPAVFSIDSGTGQITVADSTLLDFETTPTLTLDVEVTDGDGGMDTALVTINLLNQASISGVVYFDVNENGMFDADEPGSDGVVVDLLDDSNNPILDGLGDPITAITSDGGFYLFEDLDPGIYRLFENQPAGVLDGAEQLGSLGGLIVGDDRMELTLARTDAFDYAFSEIGQLPGTGSAGSIAFWQNIRGQDLISQGGTQLAGWLTTNFENVFGESLDGSSGSEVAQFYREQLFRQKGKKSPRAAKVDAQFMSTALSTYFTNRNLAGEVATSFGFTVTDTGIGTTIVNVGSNGAAFGVADGTDLTILQLLLATDALTDQPDSELGFSAIYDTNGDGVLDASEDLLRAMANSIYFAINIGSSI